MGMTRKAVNDVVDGVFSIWREWGVTPNVSREELTTLLMGHIKRETDFHEVVQGLLRRPVGDRSETKAEAGETKEDAESTDAG